MALLIGLDIGSSGARAIAISAEDGALVAEASEALAVSRPRPGWTEQDPDLWWDAARRTLRAVAAEVSGQELLGLGLTGQMHGSVFLDEADEVLRPALLWNDQRTAAQAAAMEERIGRDRLIEICGNPAITGFQAPKVLWLRDEEPEHYERVRTVLLPKDHLRLRLTGEKATDASDASGTLLLDLAARDWSDELLDALDLPRAWFPTVVEGTEQTGGLLASVAEELGLPAGLPVAAGGGDNAAAAVGLGLVREGVVSSSIGTSGVVFAHRDEVTVDPGGRVHACCHAFPGAYHLMGVTLSAGAALTWWHDVAGSGDDLDVLVAEAAEVPPGARGLLFAPYLAGERSPHVDPTARGAFVGLTAGHGRGELTRAVLEGVALSLRDGLDVMRSIGVDVDEVRAVGGGGRSELWRQVQADVYGTTVRRTEVEEGPAFGAALLAGVASGTYADVHEAVERVRLREGAEQPDPARAARYDELSAIYGGIYGALRATGEALAPFDDAPVEL